MAFAAKPHFKDARHQHRYSCHCLLKAVYSLNLNIRQTIQSLNYEPAFCISMTFTHLNVLTIPERALHLLFQ